jgi:chemotaxis response regulator CheB
VSTKVKVFFVSENRLLRDTLARIFEQEQDVAVVGAARQSREATEEISRTRPDVLLLNPPALAMPDLNDLSRRLDYVCACSLILQSSRWGCPTSVSARVFR